MPYNKFSNSIVESDDADTDTSSNSSQITSLYKTPSIMGNICDMIVNQHSYKEMQHYALFLQPKVEGRGL